MIEVKASVTIEKPPKVVWDYVAQIDKWWLASNLKEHIELSLVDTKKVEADAKFVLKEKIAGVRGEALAKIAEFLPPRKLVWQSLHAEYRLPGIKIPVKEGGTFEIVETNNGCELSHYVWGELHSIPLKGMLEWFFKAVLRGEKKDYEHTYRELLFIKRQLESAHA